MKILVINTGSSSIKYQLFLMPDKIVLANGVLEKIGEATSRIKHEVFKPQSLKQVIEEHIPDHKTGLQTIVDLLTHPDHGVIEDVSEVDAVGHRVVHGGEDFQAPTLINDDVLDAIKRNSPLAPLHNPANIMGIETARLFFKEAHQVAVFDTAFHQTIPAKAFLYALPHDLYKSHKIRRYGFHGTSHHYVSEQAALYLKRPLSALNLITIHLGNGGSITAIKGGQSIDTSMGMTPLEGLVMGTRSGDIDPAIPYFLCKNIGLSIEEVDSLLNTKSGLKGICDNNDMRDILALREKGDQRAKLAIEMYCYRIKKYIGAYSAVIGRLDAIIFTAGIGENSREIREEVCCELEHIGIRLDSEKSRQRGMGIKELQVDGACTKILLIPTNEELKIALETMTLVG
ncbi:acetate kinase [bacterium]|nr:acetate kinase [bacterium]